MAEPAQPGEPTQATEAAQPGESTQATEPAQPGEPTPATEAAQPGALERATKVEHAAQPGEATQATEATQRRARSQAPTLVPPAPPAQPTQATAQARPSEPGWIANDEVVYLRPDGTRVPGRIAIAAPHVVEDYFGCTISLDGMRADFTNRSKPITVMGETALQALLLATRFTGRMLRVFLDSGGRVLYVGGEGDDDGVGDIDMPLDAFFGPLLADRESSS